MSYRLSSIAAFVSQRLLYFQSSIFIALLLFGQVFFSILAHSMGVENRLVILPFRLLIASYSLFVILGNIVANKSRLLDAFPLSLTAFWFFYFAGLLRDYFVLGVSTALPVWEFFAWGIGGCFLPSLACYLLFSNPDRGQSSISILSLGFLLLGSSTLVFIFSEGINLQQRFELPSLNPINASHSFFLLSLFALSSLAYRYYSTVRSFFTAAVCAFGVLMGIYAGSRGALLAFVCSFVIVFLASNFNKLWALLPLTLSALMLTQFDPSGLFVRLASVGSDLNSILRLSAIRESISVFWANPLLGAGFGYHLNLSASVDDGLMWYPHNFIFESLALGGLVLTIPFLACIFFSVRSCISSLGNSSKSDLWRIAILIQAIGYVTFSGHLANVPMFWIALGLASSLSPSKIAITRP